MFWAPTQTPLPSGAAAVGSATASRTAARDTKGGHRILITPSTRVRAAIVRASSSASAGVECIFQFPATITRRMGESCQTSGLCLAVEREPLDALQCALHPRPVIPEALGPLGEGRLPGLPAGPP